jgi:predicted PhzF superfamily epimerase YddE/YHI9
MERFVAGLIDVFAETPLTGNPLAVVEGTDALSDERLANIAREFQQAETTFIMRSTRADKKLRSFTASGAEVFGAGHNALGAWLWLAEHGDLGSLERTQRAYARFFNPTVGLWEDAATGTAAGPLCAYLGSLGMLAADNALVIEQGALMGRRSALHVRLGPDAELSGSGVVVLRGEMVL